MTIPTCQMARVNEPFDHIDHTLTRGGITAKCHSTMGGGGRKIDLRHVGQIGEAKQTYPDDKFKVKVQGHFYDRNAFSCQFACLFRNTRYRNRRGHQTI